LDLLNYLSIFCIQLHTKISNVLKKKRNLFVYLLISFFWPLIFTDFPWKRRHGDL
jgi:hypothetical protein